MQEQYHATEKEGHRRSHLAPFRAAVRASLIRLLDDDEIPKPVLTRTARLILGICLQHCRVFEYHYTAETLLNEMGLEEHDEDGLLKEVAASPTVQQANQLYSGRSWAESLLNAQKR